MTSSTHSERPSSNRRPIGLDLFPQRRVGQPAAPRELVVLEMLLSGGPRNHGRHRGVGDGIFQQHLRPALGVDLLGSCSPVEGMRRVISGSAGGPASAPSTSRVPRVMPKPAAAAAVLRTARRDNRKSLITAPDRIPGRPGTTGVRGEAPQAAGAAKAPAFKAHVLTKDELDGLLATAWRTSQCPPRPRRARMLIPHTESVF
jgi:hypothetical protein